MNSEKPSFSSRTFNRIQIIRSIVEGYHGDSPFFRYLKSFFASNKSFGSKDRKIYRSWCYAWFRVGKSLPGMEFNERLCWGYYLVNGAADPLFMEIATAVIQYPMPDGPLEFRIKHAQQAIGVKSIEHLVPFNAELSDGIMRTEWSMSYLVQPFVFIRVKQSRLSEVAGELEARRFDAQPTALANAFSFVENTDLLSLDSFTKGFFEIQDLSSQMVCDNLPIKNGTHWWDCCSGAGGKSLLIADQFPDVFITCSDIRPSILENLQERVRKAELKNVSTLLLDATTQIPSVDFFDGILVDAPCSGSGTWRRNPENLSFFKESSIYEYQEKQLSILRNVNRSLKKNGFLVYITCSVFRAENEEVIARFSDSAEFQIIEMKVVPGFINNADSMFVAVLRKVS